MKVGAVANTPFSSVTVAVYAKPETETNAVVTAWVSRVTVSTTFVADAAVTLDFVHAALVKSSEKVI
jgi:hypothetical protein